MSILLHGHHANDESCPLSFDMDTAERVLRIEHCNRGREQGQVWPSVCPRTGPKEQHKED